MVFCWIGFKTETGLQLPSLTQKEYISAEADPPASIGGIIVMREWEKTRTGTAHAAEGTDYWPGAYAFRTPHLSLSANKLSETWVYQS